MLCWIKNKRVTPTVKWTNSEMIQCMTTAGLSNKDFFYLKPKNTYKKPEKKPNYNFCIKPEKSQTNMRF